MRAWLQAVRPADWRVWVMVLAFLVGAPVALAVLAFVLFMFGWFPVLVVMPVTIAGVGLLIGLLSDAWRAAASVQRIKRG